MLPDSMSYRFVLLALALCACPVIAQTPEWQLMTREDGCVSLQLLVRMMRLPRSPVSPEDFAQMLQERGETAVLGPLENSPPELIGQVVQVRLANGKAPIFARPEVCRRLER